MSVSIILAQKGNEVVTVSSQSTLADAVDILAMRKIGAVVVVDKGQTVCGILSERDIVRQIAETGAEALSGSVSHCMTSNVVSCDTSETIDGVMEKMTAGRFRHLPVIEDGNLVGLISIGDVVKLKIEQAERDANEMKRYIAG